MAISQSSRSMSAFTTWRCKNAEAGMEARNQTPLLCQPKRKQVDGPKPQPCVCVCVCVSCKCINSSLAALFFIQTEREHIHSYMCIATQKGNA